MLAQEARSKVPRRLVVCLSACLSPALQSSSYGHSLICTINVNNSTNFSKLDASHEPACSHPELKSPTTLRPILPCSLTARPMSIRSLLALAHARVHAHALTLPDPAQSTPVAEPPQALSVVDAASFLLRFCILHVNPQLTQNCFE